MTSKIILKKSSVAAKAPVAGDLVFGELAINYTDSKLYFKKADGSIDAFTTAAASAPVTSVGGNIGAITDAQLLASIKNVDGAGSGLDADFLDGLNASAFYLASNPNGYTNNTGTVTSVGATAPLVSSGGNTPSISIPAANSTTNGFMSSAYASKLDGIAAGATNVTNTNQLTNGAGYITSAALSSYLPLTGGSITGALNINRRRLSFSSSYNDSNHSIYNNHENIDGEGVWDGMKMNVYNGLQVRTGNASGVTPTLNFAVYNGQGVHIPSAFTMGSRSNSANFGGNTGGMSGNSFVAEVRANGAKPTLTFHYEGVATTHLEHLSDGSLNVWRPANEGTSVFKIGNNIALHAGNYTSYTPSLTGSGASGTWGINVTGSAGSVAWGNVSSKPSNIMYYQGFTLDANTMDSNATGFTYSNNAPATGPIARFSTGGGYDLWLNAAYTGGNQLYFRTRNGDTASINSWKALASYGVNYSDSLFATIYYDSQNTAYFTDPAGRSRQSQIDFGDGGYYIHGGDWGMRNTTPYGWIQFGPANSSHAHIYTDRSNFYFNQQIQVNGGSQINTSDIRAGIFYDVNNTGYYLDPSSITSLRTVGSWRSDSSTWDGEFSGKIQYHSNNWYFQAAGEFIWRNSGGSNVIYGDQSGNHWATASSRSPIFYDNNNTGYYTDPNGSSRLGTVNADTLRSYNNIYLDNQYGSSVIGVYSSTRYQGVFSMGDSYKLAIDGTTTGNLYGLAWSHPNAGGTAGNLNTHGLLVLENGGFLAAVSGSIRSRDDMRSPIFYDSNNTGYYVDPNDTSRLNYLRPNRISLVGNQDNGSPRWDFKAYVVESQHHYAQTSTQSMYIGEDNYIYMRTHTEASGSHRAPIFYDSNNTGYYADLNSTTYLYYLQSATTVRADSDRRLKENITPITSALSLVRQLQGCRYTRNDLADKTKVYIGMIAQDVLPIVPEVVSGSEAGKYSLGYAELVPVLNEAVKELDEIVSKQAAIIAKLEERLSKLLGE